MTVTCHDLWWVTVWRRLQGRRQGKGRRHEKVLYNSIFHYSRCLLPGPCGCSKKHKQRELEGWPVLITVASSGLQLTGMSGELQLPAPSPLPCRRGHLAVALTCWVAGRVRHLQRSPCALRLAVFLRSLLSKHNVII